MAVLDVEEIMEIFDLRTILEAHVGRIATQKRTENDVAEVRAILGRLEGIKVSGGSGIDQWSIWNRRFHSRLCDSSGHRHLYQVVNSFRDMVEPYIQMELNMTGNVTEAQKEHRQIFDAFAKRDAERVAQLSAQHCEHTAQRLIYALQRRKLLSLAG